MADFMKSEELERLPFFDPPTEPREMPPYDPEKERAVAISPEGKNNPSNK
jgi:hypothetical protein